MFYVSKDARPMNACVETLTQGIWSAIRGETGTAEEISFIGKGELSSAFPVTDFASAVIATTGLAISDLLMATLDLRPTLTIDRRLASLWFGMSIRPIGWKLPPVWDAFAGDYRTRDGWIKLHTNAPHHRAAAMRVVGQHPDLTAMADAVKSWLATELETAIVGEGGCAAAMRSAAEWGVHDQGRAVASEP